MIKIKNKTFKEIDSTEGVRMTYSQLIVFGMNTIPVSQGMTFGEMDKHLDLKKKIDSAGGIMILDKEELDYLIHVQF